MIEAYNDNWHVVSGHLIYERKDGDVYQYCSADIENGSLLATIDIDENAVLWIYNSGMYAFMDDSMILFDFDGNEVARFYEYDFDFIEDE